jgi:hypothetical protein
VHHYTLHSAWVEAWAQSAVESPSGGSKRDARSFSAEATKAAKPSAMQQSCGSNGNQSTMQPAVGADYLPQPLRKEGSKTVCSSKKGRPIGLKIIQKSDSKSFKIN